MGMLPKNMLVEEIVITSSLDQRVKCNKLFAFMRRRLRSCDQSAGAVDDSWGSFRRRRDNRSPRAGWWQQCFGGRSSLQLLRRAERITLACSVSKAELFRCCETVRCER
jgi:hypothetical protein